MQPKGDLWKQSDLQKMTADLSVPPVAEKYRRWDTLPETIAPIVCRPCTWT